PDKHYQFTQWSDGNTQNPRTDTNVTADLAVTAQFARKHARFVVHPSRSNNPSSNNSTGNTQIDAAPGDTIVVQQDSGQQTTLTVQQVGADYAILALDTSSTGNFRVGLHQTVEQEHLAITLNGINQNAALLTFRTLSGPSTPVYTVIRQLPPVVKYT